MATSESGTRPDTFAKSRGKTLFRWNIQEEQVTDPMTGEASVKYIYNEVWIDGKVTKAKILEAMRFAELEEDDSDVNEVTKQYEDARSNIRQFADMSYADLDIYVDKNVTDLKSVRAFLKKLAKVVLGVLKQ